MHEHAITTSAGRLSSFVTLTYAPEHVPRDGSVNARDWQLFAKRVRKELGPFRFFMCAEYGEQNDRPHYHAIMFGQGFESDRELLKVGKFGNLYYQPDLSRLWGKGFASVGSVTWQSAAYVARYSTKKATGALAESRYRRTDGQRSWAVRPEFALMSRGGRHGKGIGSAWIERFASDVYPSDELVVGGKRMRTPRYYDTQVDPALLVSAKAKRLELARERAHDLTRERLEAREIILSQRGNARPL